MQKQNSKTEITIRKLKSAKYIEDSSRKIVFMSNSIQCQNNKENYIDKSQIKMISSQKIDEKRSSSSSNLTSNRKDVLSTSISNLKKPNIAPLSPSSPSLVNRINIDLSLVFNSPIYSQKGSKDLSILSYNDKGSARTNKSAIISTFRSNSQKNDNNKLKQGKEQQNNCETSIGNINASLAEKYKKFLNKNTSSSIDINVKYDDSLKINNDIDKSNHTRSQSVTKNRCLIDLYENSIKLPLQETQNHDEASAKKKKKDLSAGKKRTENIRLSNLEFDEIKSTRVRKNPSTVLSLDLRSPNYHELKKSMPFFIDQKSSRTRKGQETSRSSNNKRNKLLIIDGVETSRYYKDKVNLTYHNRDDSIIKNKSPSSLMIVNPKEDSISTYKIDEMSTFISNKYNVEDKNNEKSGYIKIEDNMKMIDGVDMDIIKNVEQKSLSPNKKNGTTYNNNNNNNENDNLKKKIESKNKALINNFFGNENHFLQNRPNINMSNYSVERNTKKFDENRQKLLNNQKVFQMSKSKEKEKEALGQSKDFQMNKISNNNKEKDPKKIPEEKITLYAEKENIIDKIKAKENLNEKSINQSKEKGNVKPLELYQKIITKMSKQVEKSNSASFKDLQIHKEKTNNNIIENDVVIDPVIGVKLDKKIKTKGLSDFITQVKQGSGLPIKNLSPMTASAKDIKSNFDLSISTTKALKFKTIDESFNINNNSKTTSNISKIRKYPSINENPEENTFSFSKVSNNLNDSHTEQNQITPKKDNYNNSIMSIKPSYVDDSNANTNTNTNNNTNYYGSQNETYFISNLVRYTKSPDNENYFCKLYKEYLFQTMQAMQFCSELKAVDQVELAKKKVYLNKRESHKDKKTLVFDLDETLIHCNENLNIPCDVILPIKFPTGEIVEAGVNIRPFAIECLEELNKHFEIIVFTASHGCYANAVLDYLDPSGQLIHHRLFRENCISTEQGVYIKDLRIFANRNIKDIALIDNALYSFGYQMQNGVPIVPFYYNKQDIELKNLIPYVLNFLTIKDIRELNQKTFKWHLCNPNDTYDQFLDKLLSND